jgi:amino acid transporter
VIEFSRKLPSAGGYVSYIARGLGPHARAYTGWTFFLYAMVLPAEVTIIWAGIAQALVRRAQESGGDAGYRAQSPPGAFVGEDAVLGGDPGGVFRRARWPVDEQPHAGAGAGAEVIVVDW